jgi:hypothetical protein
VRDGQRVTSVERQEQKDLLKRRETTPALRAKNVTSNEDSNELSQRSTPAKSIVHWVLSHAVEKISLTCKLHVLCTGVEIQTEVLQRNCVCHVLILLFWIAIVKLNSKWLC